MVEYTLHPVSPRLLALLWANLWDRGKEEFERVPLSLHNAFYLFLGYASASPRSIILCHGDDPVLVAGICEDFTFMQATQDFDRHARQIIRTLRREIDKYGRDVHIYSQMVHPKSARFFDALGYEQEIGWQQMTAAGFPLYRFKRR